MATLVKVICVPLAKNFDTKPTGRPRTVTVTVIINIACTLIGNY